MSSRRSSFYFHRILCGFVLALAVAGDKQFNCPNGGEPKVDENGVSIQCLPGQSSDSVCGRGYSCYFSGFNYQCCPTSEDDYDDAHDACPFGTTAVLDGVGKPIPCSTLKRCSKSTSFCYGSTSVCCEAKVASASKTTSGVDIDVTEQPTTQESDFQKKIDPDELKATSGEQTSAVDIASLECPKHTLTILNGDGLPLECDAAKQCPQQNMFCYSSAGHSICCEGSGTARTDLDDDDGPANPLKYKPEDAERAKETLKVLHEIEQAVLTAKPERQSTEASSTEADTTTTESTASSNSEGPRPPGIRPSSSSDNSEGPSRPGTKHYADSDDESALTNQPATEPSKQYADNEGSFFTVQKPSTQRPKQRKVKDSEVTGPAKAQAVKLHPHEAGPPAATYEGIEYQPHALGGYAVSKKLHGTNLKVPRPEKKALVQQFLLDQIKDGWPYNEKFYRPENIAILRKGSRPSAVVHFPN